VSSPTIRSVRTTDLTADERQTLRALFDAAWSGKDDEFSEDDWRSATGGVHVLLEVEGRIRSHASVVDRVLETGGSTLKTGYVEAVATWPADQQRGYATSVMRAVGAYVHDRSELGALDTGIDSFYERLGWERWRGPTAVRTERGVIGTPEEDGLVMVIRTATTPADLDLDAPITCDWRPGDVW
jgi:aminoglycoside 2'-N-acetyltransferase I